MHRDPGPDPSVRQGYGGGQPGFEGRQGDRLRISRVQWGRQTTTIKMLMNIIFPTAGESRVFGKRSQDLDQQDYARIGYVSENQKLPDWMTVDQLLRFLRPMYPTWDDQFCDLLLEFFGLPKERKIAQLSRGMRMKAALVSSLAYRPELLMMDEPFTGLDPLVRDELTQGILEMTQQEHWTV